MGVGAMSPGAEVTRLSATDLGAEVPGRAQQKIIRGRGATDLVLYSNSTVTRRVRRAPHARKPRWLDPSALSGCVKLFSNCCCCGLHCSVRRKPTPSLGKGHESKPNCRRTKALLRFLGVFSPRGLSHWRARKKLLKM